MSFLKKGLGKKEPEKGFSREEFLKLKPIKNPYLKWTKSEMGEVVITLKLRETKKGDFLSKLFPAPKEKRISLDQIGSFVWDRCDGKHSIDDIAKELCDEYKMLRQEAEVSLSTFIQELSKRRFIGVLIPEGKEKEGEEPSALRKMKIP